MLWKIRYRNRVTLTEFQRTLNDTAAPQVPPPLQALWHDGKGDWEAAHHIAQDVDDADGAWVHAYLHRKEGDLSNARYWYRQAGQEPATDALESEWTRIVSNLLNRP